MSPLHQPALLATTSFEDNLTLALVVFVIGMIATVGTFATVFVAHRRAERDLGGRDE